MGKKTKKEKKKQFWTDFKGFISKGNVVDLAVALVVGSAFNKIVSQLVDSFINPLISIFIGGFNLNDWKYVYKPAEYNDAGELLKAEVAFTYGTFIQTVIDFLIIALTVFVVVKLYAKLKCASINGLKRCRKSYALKLLALLECIRRDGFNHGIFSKIDADKIVR